MNCAWKEIEVAKDFDSGRRRQLVCYACPIDGLLTKGRVMTGKTCAACDCKLDANAIKVRIDSQVVEVCCEECARKLRAARAEHQGTSTVR
jgi:hypothetical protein